MSSRLCQENVYAFRFFPDEGVRNPGVERVVAVLRAAIERHAKATRGGQEGERGGALWVGSDAVVAADAPERRVVDGASATETPVLRSAGQILITLRMQEKIFAQALRTAESQLGQEGVPGRIGLVKCSPSSLGRVKVGRELRAAERYEATIAKGLGLWIYRMVATLATLWFAIWSLLTQALEMIAVACAGVIAGFAFAFLTVFQQLLLIIARWASHHIGSKRFALFASLLRRGQTLHQRFAKRLMQPALAGSFEAARLVARFPMILAASLPCLWLLRRICFVPHRRLLPAFFASRPIYTGCGALQDDGCFRLDPPPWLGWRHRIASGGDLILRDTTIELMRQMITAAEGLWRGEWFRFKQLWRARQFLVLPVVSGNRAQLSDYLRLGITQWLIQLVEAGALRQAPRLVNPDSAYGHLCGDTSLAQSVSLRDGGSSTALQLQLWYLTAAQTWLKSQPATDLDRHELIGVWSETLTALADDPGRLVGRVDCVTKRYLIEAAAPDSTFADQKRIDLAYHELVTGYFDWLDREGVAMHLATPDEIERVLAEPERVLRKAFVTRPNEGIAFRGERLSIRWHSVRVGTWWKPRLVPSDPEPVAP